MTFHIHGGQRQLVVSGIALRLLGLEASIFTHQSTSAAYFLFLIQFGTLS